MKCVCMAVRRGDPCVAVSLEVESVGGGAESVVIAGVHLPAGDLAGRRQGILEGIQALDGVDVQRVLVVGDMNVRDDAEVKVLCSRLRVGEARYEGFSWGSRGNKFYENMEYNGPGIRKDRILHGKKIWAEAHLVGERKQFFDGCGFFV